MRFHTRSINVRCAFGSRGRHHKGCAAFATTEIRNERNASYGIYCRKHAEEKMTELTEMYSTRKVGRRETLQEEEQR